MDFDQIAVVGIARTPIGKFQGVLKDITATDLGAIAIKSVMDRAHLNPNHIDEVLMGCVLSAGLGQAPARQAAIKAGISNHTPCTTISKVCGSGMKAVMLACDALRLQAAKIIIAGGMENMSQAPYLLAKARGGYRLGHQTIYDHMMLDGLEDAYEPGKSMGYFAEQAVATFQFTREQQDQYAIESFSNAKLASDDGSFVNEITPIPISDKIIAHDEHPASVKIEKIPSLRPAFITPGTVTAGNTSPIADGAAALALMPYHLAIEQNIKPLAIIKGYCAYAAKPSEFTSAPVFAIQKLLAQLDWQIDHVDLFEINEAFAAVALIAMQELAIPRAKLNVHGGGISLGHPIGASGARILVTLINTLSARHLTRGIAALCIGGGEATAVAVELAS